MGRNLEFGVDEWYHCYNRGVDRRKIFLGKKDYDRFLALLYLGNSSIPAHLSNLTQSKQGSTLLGLAMEEERGETLVDVGAYCLMPNHYHLLIREKEPGGITEYMRKLGTGYTMYFNKKEERTGPLLGGTFKAKHIADDRYFRRVVNYIHANSAELVEPKWKEGVARSPKKTAEFLASYQYSSLPEYSGHLSSSHSTSIVNMELVRDMYEELPTIKDLFEEAVVFAPEVDIDD